MDNEKPGKDIITPGGEAKKPLDDDHKILVAANRNELDLQREIREANAEGYGRPDADLAQSRRSHIMPTADNHADTDLSDDGTNVVWWDGKDDPQNPFNWPVWEKTLNCVLVSIMTFVTPLGSSIFAPGVPEVMKEFASDSSILESFVVSVYLLGFAFGPVLIAPLSEIYGRVIVYHVCHVAFTAFTVACALAPSLNTLIVFRFFCGTFGCASVTNGSGTIADMIKQERRGVVMSLYTIGPLLGPLIGPLVGGFISQSLGWRWTFWIVAIVGGAVTLFSFFTMRESYAYVVLDRKTKKLRKETGNPLLRSKLDSGLSPADFFKRSIIRPVKLLVKSPMVLAGSLYLGVIYGYLYLMLTTITSVFQGTYGFSTGIVGLAYLGLGLGNAIGLVLFSTTSDKYIKRKAAEADRVAEETGKPKEGMKPEYRLPLLPLSAVLVPIGFFVYGWTAQYHVFWIVPIIGHVPVGIGVIIVFMCLQTYMVDAFTAYAASVMAAMTIVRSFFGAFLPLAGLPLYDSLGLGWGNSLLGFIAVATIPVSFALLKYGEPLRKRYAVTSI